jgi:hypothetical protein
VFGGGQSQLQSEQEGISSGRTTLHVQGEFR